MKKLFIIVVLALFVAGCGDSSEIDYDNVFIPAIKGMDVYQEIKELKQEMKQLQCYHEDVVYDKRESYFRGGSIIQYTVRCSLCGKYIGQISEEKYLSIQIREAKERIAELKSVGH